MKLSEKNLGARTNNKVKTKQWIVASAVIGGIAVAALAGAYITSDSSSQQALLRIDKPTTKSIGGGVNDVDKEAFRVQINQQVNEATKRMAELDKQNAELKAENERIRAEEAKKRAEQDKKMEDFLKAQSNSNRAQVGAGTAPPPPPGGFTGNNPFTQQGQAPQPPQARAGNFLGIGPDGKPLPASGGAAGSRIVREEIKEAPAGAAGTGAQGGQNQPRTGAQGPEAVPKTAETYIPSGSYVRAVLLNGLDAPTGGNSQQSPHPILLRMVDSARLPNGVKSDIKDCVMTGNGFGDVASERAYIRIDRISCVDADGNAIDNKVTGYIAGEDGKTGLRGRIVQKTGQLLSNALLAGIGSGIGNAFRAGGVTTTQSPLTGATTETTNDAFKSGVGSGVSKAFDLLASYYIKLAEKTFPVIEVDAGRTVDVVFQQGLSIER